MGNALLLTEQDVRRVLPMPDLIAAMEGAMAQFSAGAVRQPVRSVIEVGPALIVKTEAMALAIRALATSSASCRPR